MTLGSVIEFMAEAKKLRWDKHRISQAAVDLADLILLAAQRKMSGNERKCLDLLCAMSQGGKAKAFVQGLFSQVLTLPDEAQAQVQLEKLITQCGGIPRELGALASLRVSLFKLAGRSQLSTLKNLLLGSFEALYQPYEEKQLARIMKEDAKEGSLSSLRLLYPRSMGSMGTQQYSQAILPLFSDPRHFTVELDLRQLCPQVSLYHFEDGVARLKQKLSPFVSASIAAAGRHPIALVEGAGALAQVAAAALQELTADNPRLDISLDLCAYLPESGKLLKKICKWANARKNGAAIKLRILKGSHLEKQRSQVQRERHGEQVCAHKQETDARFKQMVLQCIESPSIEPIIATHNLWDLSYALLAWARFGRSGKLKLSFARGLASHVARYLAQQDCEPIAQSRLYASEHESLMLAELHELFHEATRKDSIFALPSKLSSSHVEWMKLAQKYRQSCTQQESLDSAPAPQNNGYLSPIQRSKQRKQMREAVEKQILLNKKDFQLGELAERSLLRVVARSPQRIDNAISYGFDSLLFEDARRALKASIAAPLPDSSHEKRSKQLHKLAKYLQQKRSSLAAALVYDCGHTLADADAELGQAISLCQLYADSLAEHSWHDGSQAQTGGICYLRPNCISPLLQTIEGIASAWMAGQKIIWHPAHNALHMAEQLELILKQSGLKRPQVLVLLSAHNQIEDIIRCTPELTHSFLGEVRQPAPPATQACVVQQVQQCCSVYLAADAAWQEALAELVHAFAYRSGQMASSPHLLIVANNIYQDASFIAALKDALSALRTGPSTALTEEMGPLVAPLSPEQRARLSQLSKGESWLIPPRFGPEKSSFCPAFVRLGLSQQSPILSDEIAWFVPQLCLAPVSSENEALHLQARLSQGGNAAIYTHNETLIARWKAEIRPRHAFINYAPHSGLPGLIPFAGEAQGLPSRGSGNFVPAYCTWSEKARPQLRSNQCHISFTPWDILDPRPKGEDLMRLRAAADSISHCWESLMPSPTSLLLCHGESNQRSYKAKNLSVRAENSMSDIDLSIVLMAALKANCRTELSLAGTRAWLTDRIESLGIKLRHETCGEWEARFAQLGREGYHLRAPQAKESSFIAARAAGLALDASSVMANGRIELLKCCQENYCTQGD